MFSSIQTLDEGWKYGRTQYYLENHKGDNFYNTTYSFDDVEDFMRTMFKVNQDDRFSELVRLLEFPETVSLVYDYKSARDNKPLPFYGAYKYANIYWKGGVSADILNNIAMVQLYPRTFTMGGGNLKLINYETFKYYYGIDSSNVYRGRFDTHIKIDDFKRENRIFSNIDPTYVIATTFTLDANVVVFDILFRHQQEMKDNTITFLTTGKPFRGSFEAEIEINVELIQNLEDETSSKSKVTLNKTNNFMSLETLTNKMLHEWNANLLYYNYEINSLKDQLLSQYNKMISQIQSDSYWQIDEICEEIPRLKCKVPSVEAVWIKEKESCKDIAQTWNSYSTECQIYSSNGTWIQSTNTWNSWVNSCISEQQNIWIEFDSRSILDECITMELSWTRIYSNNTWAKRADSDQSKLNEINQKLWLANEWNRLMHELVDSVYCSIDFPEEEKPDNYTRWPDKKYYYYN